MDFIQTNAGDIFAAPIQNPLHLELNDDVDGDGVLEVNACRGTPVRIVPAPAPRHNNSTSLSNDLSQRSANCQCLRACFFIALTASVTLLPCRLV